MTDQPTPLYCANHPQTETTLRCNRCEKPICAKCAVLTPTGYRCKDCVRSQQKIFDTTVWYDYITSFVVAGFLSLIGSYFVPKLGFFSIFLAPLAGIVIAEAVRLVVRRRRSKRLTQLTALATVLGSLPVLLLTLIPMLALLTQGGFGLLLNVVWQVVYTVMATSTVLYRMGGIRGKT
jgi:asparagine N-glycosylation enzyme membrane subunit Stt3